MSFPVVLIAFSRPFHLREMSLWLTSVDTAYVNSWFINNWLLISRNDNSGSQ